MRMYGGRWLSILAIGSMGLPAADELTLANNDPLAQPLDDLTFLDEGLWVEAVSRRRQPITRAPQSVTVIEPGELSASPAATIPDYLRYVPGVDVYQNRHGQFDVGLRGFNGISSPRTLALVDGRPFSSEELGSQFWIGPLHQTDIRRIEVVKGPASVTYGANAFGGVIAILPREVGDRWELHTLATTGDHGHQEIDATTMGPLPWVPDMYVKVSAGNSQRDDWSGVQGSAPADHSRARQTGDVDLRAERYHLLTGYRIEEDISLELDWQRFALYDWEMIEDFSPGTNWIHQIDDRIGLRLRSPWGEIEQLYTVSDGDYSNSIANFDPLRAFRYTQAGFKSEAWNTRGQFEFEIGRHHLTAGASYERWKSESNLWASNGRYTDESTWEEVTVTNKAAFTEHQWDVDGTWSTTAGLRVDDHNLVGTNVSPRLAVNRRFGHDYYARASFSSGYRLPTAVESYMEEFFFTTADNIKAERITSLDLSITGRPVDGIRLEVGTFLNRSNDLLFFTALDESAMQQAWLDFLAAGDPENVPGPFFEIRNLDNPNLGYGLETKIEWQTTDLVELWLGGTWQRYRFKDRVDYESTGFVDPLTSDTIFAFNESLPRDINAPPEWKSAIGITYAEQGFTAQGIVRYVSSRKIFSFGGSDFEENGDIATQRVDDRLVFDAAVSWNGDIGPSTTATIRVGIMNLFDSSDPETFSPDQALLVSDDEVAYSSEIGRRFTASAQFSF